MNPDHYSNGIDEAKPTKRITTMPIDLLLERGHRGEILPGELAAMLRHAEEYVRDEVNPPEARERVKTVWLQNRHAPPWLEFTPRRADGE